MEDKLAAQVRKYASHWRAWNEWVNELERCAARHPTSTAQAMYWLIDTILSVYERFLRDHFGIEVRPLCEIEAKDPRRVVKEDIRKNVRTIQNATERALSHTANAQTRLRASLMRLKDVGIRVLLLSMTLRGIGFSMVAAALEAEENGEDPDRAACDAFLSTWRIIWPCWYGIQSTRSTITPAQKQKAVAQLAGWVASKTSLKYKRLRVALTDETYGSPFDNLLLKAPGATYIEWADGDEEEGFETLVRRVERRLTKEGPKLGTEPLEENSFSDEDLALAQFETQEELLNLISQANLSEHEEAVVRLELEDQPTKDIATQLDCTESTVRGFRKRYVKKVRKLRAS